MSKFLPTSGFKWIDPKNVDSSKYSSNSFKRCALEVDLEYPKELHMNYKARIKTKKRIAICFSAIFYQICISH